MNNAIYLDAEFMDIVSSLKIRLEDHIEDIHCIISYIEDDTSHEVKDEMELKEKIELVDGYIEQIQDNLKVIKDRYDQEKFGIVEELN